MININIGFEIKESTDVRAATGRPNKRGNLS